MSNNDIILIKLFQPFAHYRNPFTWTWPQTYPLPPRSTVIGMLQRWVGDYYGQKNREKWRELEVAIFGRHVTKFHNYVQLYKSSKYELVFFGGRPRINGNKGIIHGPPGYRMEMTPTVFEELLGVELIILLRNYDNLFSLDDLKNVKEVLYLGRAEDTVFIEDVKGISEGKKIDYCFLVPYSFWYLAENSSEIEELSKSYSTFLVPLHVEFKIIKDKEKDDVVKSRSELLVYREKVKREVVWSNAENRRLFYIPRSSTLLKQGKRIYYDDNAFIDVPKGAWLRGDYK